MMKMHTCANCGAELEPQARFCTQCGTESAPAPADSGAHLAAGAPAAPPERREARLTLKRGGVPSAESFPLGECCVIGRFDTDTGPVDLDLGCLPEGGAISRRHAEIHLTPAGCVVKDLGSRNGTYLRTMSQGARLPVNGEQAIRDGDELIFGNVCFEFREQTGREAA